MKMCDCQSVSLSLLTRRGGHLMPSSSVLVLQCRDGAYSNFVAKISGIDTAVALWYSVILPALFVWSYDTFYGQAAMLLAVALLYRVSWWSGWSGINSCDIYLLLMTMFWIALGVVKNCVSDILRVCRHFFSTVRVRQWPIIPDFINKHIDACARNCDGGKFFYLIFSDILSQSGRTTFHVIHVEKRAVQWCVYQIISTHN
jgi:hypothetical protein